MKCLVITLGGKDELDAANQLLDEASTCVEINKVFLLDLKLVRVHVLMKLGRDLEALGILQAMLPEAKVYTTNPHFYGQTLLQLADILLNLDRNQEAREVATELIAFAKAKFGPEDSPTLEAMRAYAIICAKLGRVEEAKAHFEDVLTTKTRVLGRDHPSTQLTWQIMLYYGVAEPSG